MSTFPLVNLIKDFLSLCRFDTALEYACHTSLVQLMVDDSVSFGPALHPSGLNNVGRQRAIQHVRHDLLAPYRYWMSRKERFINNHWVFRCCIRHLWCCIRHWFFRHCPRVLRHWVISPGSHTSSCNRHTLLSPRVRTISPRVRDAVNPSGDCRNHIF